MYKAIILATLTAFGMLAEEPVAIGGIRASTKVYLSAMTNEPSALTAQTVTNIANTIAQRETRNLVRTGEVDTKITTATNAVLRKVPAMITQATTALDKSTAHIVKVDKLPAVGETNVIYVVDSGAITNGEPGDFDGEWIWVPGVYRTAETYNIKVLRHIIPEGTFPAAEDFWYATNVWSHEAVIELERTQSNWVDFDENTYWYYEAYSATDPETGYVIDISKEDDAYWYLYASANNATAGSDFYRDGSDWAAYTVEYCVLYQPLAPTNVEEARNARYADVYVDLRADTGAEVEVPIYTPFFAGVSGVATQTIVAARWERLGAHTTTTNFYGLSRVTTNSLLQVYDTRTVTNTYTKPKFVTGSVYGQNTEQFNFYFPSTAYTNVNRETGEPTGDTLGLGVGNGNSRLYTCEAGVGGATTNALLGFTWYVGGGYMQVAFLLQLADGSYQSILDYSYLSEAYDLDYWGWKYGEEHTFDEYFERASCWIQFYASDAESATEGSLSMELESFEKEEQETAWHTIGTLVTASEYANTTNRLSVIEAQLQGLEEALRVINSGE